MPAINPDEDPDLVWIPYGLKVILGTDGKVDIEELPEDVRYIYCVIQSNLEKKDWLIGV